MQTPPIPANEQERQQALDSYEVLDSIPERAFDNLVKLGRDLLGTPIILISLVDRNRQWFKACYGLDVTETSRSVSFCAHALSSDEPLVVLDAREDPRFCDNPLVTDSPFIRFYAGAPLITPAGLILGTFCAIDSEPRQNFVAGQRQRLKLLAELAMDIIGFRRDALHANEAEAALRRSEQQFQAFMDNSPVIACMKDQAGRLVYVNAAFERTFGFDRRDVLGKTDLDIFPEETAKSIRARDVNAIERGGSERVSECIPTPADSNRRFVSLRFPFQVDAATLVGVYSIDVTESDRAKAALMDSELRWQLALEGNNDGIWDWNAKTKSVFHSERWKAMLGYSNGELTDDSTVWERHMHPEDLERVKRELQDYLDRKIPVYDIEYRMRAKDGSWRCVLARGKAIWDTDGQPLRMVGSHTDFTERKRLQEELLANQRELKKRNLELEELSNAKSDLLSRMSHELRTPLNAILGFSQLLIETTQLTNDQEEYIDEVLKGGRYLLKLINELLEVVRAESGRMTLSIEPVDARHSLTEALKLVEPLSAQKRVRLRLSISEQTWIMADAQRLTQVFLNLLSNAIKYNRKGGEVIMSCELTNADRMIFSFQDTGIGISPENLPRLFTPFERLGAERTGIEGTGLGLALTRRLVEAMHGSVSVASIVDVGTTFYVDFPATSPISIQDVSPPEQEAQIECQRFAATLLYIEDNLANLKLVEKILARRPLWKLISTMQGSMGIALAREHVPDCILLDVHLPDMLGNEVLDQLRQDPITRDIPVIVLSADATSGQIARLKQAGAQEYLTKPLDVKQFMAVLEQILPQAVTGV